MTIFLAISAAIGLIAFGILMARMPALMNPTDETPLVIHPERTVVIAAFQYIDRKI